MDNQFLQELLDAVQAQGGGLVLKQGDTPQAVVMSVPKYQELLAASKKPAGGQSDTQQAGQTLKFKILITGGAGYIGSHLAHELIARGHQVWVYDNLSSGQEAQVPKEAILIKGDVRDKALLLQSLKDNDIQTIVHLASLVEVEESTQKPGEYLDVNTQGTITVLAAAKEAGVSKFIFSSTAAVYGNESPGLIKETDQTAPVDPYGTSKLLSEQIIAYYAEFLGIKTTILRFFNVCGTAKEWGIKDAHASHLIPTVLEVASGKKDKIVIFGTDYATSDGTAVRDYVHVKDIALAHVLCIEKFTEKKFRVYNVGTGKGYSVKEIINAASEITGRMIPMEIGPRRAGDAMSTVADASLIKQELGFVPENSSLENIIKSSWENN